MKKTFVSFTIDAFNAHFIDKWGTTASDLTWDEREPEELEFIELQKGKLIYGLLEASVDTPTPLSDKHFTIMNDQHEVIEWLNWNNFITWVEDLIEMEPKFTIKGLDGKVTFDTIIDKYFIRIEA
ncbi:MAG: hypothetical protein ACRCX2_18325 [Paraclostridium sp.]